jgi:hypothetical protein
MRFGQTERFAVECEVTLPPSSFLFGHICLWVGGERLGDFSQLVILTAPAFFFRDLLRFTGQRYDPVFESMSGTEALDFLHRVLYDDEDATLQESRQLQQRFARYCLCPGGGEAFDGEFVACIEYLNKDRLIWRSHHNAAIGDLFLDHGEIEDVLRSFLKWIDNCLSGR